VKRATFNVVGNRVVLRHERHCGHFDRLKDSVIGFPVQRKRGLAEPRTLLAMHSGFDSLGSAPPRMLDSLDFPQNAEEPFLLPSRWAPLQANLTAAASAERGADAEVVVN
jgi:hypothetical protein